MTSIETAPSVGSLREDVSDGRPRARARRWMLRRHYLLATAIYGVLLGTGFFETAYTDYLRGKVRELAPDYWRSHVANGSTDVLVPWLHPYNDEMVAYYVPKVHQVLRHGVPGDPYVKENRGLAASTPDAISYYLVAALVFPFSQLTTGWMAVAYFMFANWFLLVFLLFAALARERAADRAVAVSTLLSVAVIFVWSLDLFHDLILRSSLFTMSVGNWLYITTNFGIIPRRGIPYLRMPSMLITALLLFAWLVWLAFHLAGRSRTSRGANVAIGVAGGLLWLVHPPEALCALGTTGLLWLMAATGRVLERDLRVPLSWVLGALAVSGAVCLRVATLGIDAEMVRRMGNPLQWSFQLNALWTGALGVLAIALARKSALEPRNRFFVLVFGTLLVATAIIIWGRVVASVDTTLQTRFASLALALLCGFVLVEQARRRAWLAIGLRWTAAFGMALLLFNTKSFAEKSYLAAGLPAAWEEAFGWIDENTPEDATFLTTMPPLHRLLAVHTHASLLVAESFPLVSTLPLEENMRRASVLLKTLGIPFEAFEKEMLTAGTDPEWVESVITGNPPLGQFHKGWVGLVFHQDTLVSERIGDMRRIHEAAAPLDGSYYVWVNVPEDADLIRPPAGVKERWRLVYSNERVRVYHHPSRPAGVD